MQRILAQKLLSVPEPSKTKFSPERRIVSLENLVDIADGNAVSLSCSLRCKIRVVKVCRDICHDSVKEVIDDRS
ncbi:hypothetical protein D3C81_2237210 [compost metagenome]